VTGCVREKIAQCAQNPAHNAAQCTCIVCPGGVA
jgi:hypothetical protein